MIDAEQPFQNDFALEGTDENDTKFCEQAVKISCYKTSPPKIFK